MTDSSGSGEIMTSANVKREWIYVGRERGGGGRAIIK